MTMGCPWAYVKEGRGGGVHLTNLLPTRRDERGVLGAGSISVAILSSVISM